MKILEKYWIFIVFIISFFSIGLALIAELIFNILPCKMCLNQRYAYYFIIFITLVFFLTNFFSYFLKLLIFEIAIFYGLFYSIWHVGIEQKILPGPENCESSLSKSDSISKLKNQIINQDIIFCDEISWVIFGFSAATINSLLLFFLIIFNTIFLLRSYEEKNNKI